ncbi:MAG: restriction endonuclease [Candidatus Moranbacteria bacterium]|nr:restriction endonuclease [Candidatus Moranbacteria bacterium]
MHIITKTTGDKEQFSQKKLERSLRRAGASKKVAKDIVEKAIQQQEDFRTTQDVHRFALRLLKQKERPVAGRYNLKTAIMDMGPSGYPFEKFVAEIFRAQGYETETNLILKGRCVNHEIDVLAQNDTEAHIIECKFHNNKGVKSDVKTALYVKARYDDLVEGRKDNPSASGEKKTDMWIVTNTLFTQDALKYAKCSGVSMMSWGYPGEESLARMVDKLKLHPITALTRISRGQKQRLAESGLVLCRDVREKRSLLKQAGIKQRDEEKVIGEAEAICALEVLI